MKTKLSGVAETLLIPLWARAEEMKRSDALIRDDFAVRLVEQIDYDFAKFARAKHSQTGVAVRSYILDHETKAFIEKHPEAVCINLACGLDTRFYRIDNGQIDWYNLDLPDVMELRQNLLAEEGARIHNLAASVFDSGWLEKVEHEGRPVLILLEGAAMYFSEQEMRSLFAMLAEAFADASMLIEIMPPFLIGQQKHHDSVDTQKASRHHLSQGTHPLRRIPLPLGLVRPPLRDSLVEQKLQRQDCLPSFRIPLSRHGMS